jgi:transcriptional regulator with GAF, ATPase, and Fis domain
MGEILDATRELRELASLASNPHAVDEVLRRALDALQPLVPYDLAAVLSLDGDDLAVRAATGPLASARIRRHSIQLSHFPTVQRAIETRRPVALLEHHHASEEGDPYDAVLDLPDGHSCMVVPLFAGDRTLGAMTFDRRVCEPYSPEVVELAGVYGQIVALALAFAEQAALLDRYRHRLQEQRKLQDEDAGDAGRLLEESVSPRMAALVAQARQVAATDAPVLIQGETGSGKEVLAQAIHGWSPRVDQPFVKLNCAAIPENLVESELFGHSKGAFTGASEKRSGRFLVANGGTLFLDEMGEMPLATQAKLLRVLQDGTFQAVGSDQTVRVDVRVIAATHVDLTRAVAEGRFRADLYYRLAVFPVRLPPLRERPEDLPGIARNILHGIARRTGRGPWTLPPDTIAALRAHPWAGNVRELANVLERATILRPRGDLGPDLVEVEAPRPVTALPTFEEVERRYLAEVLEHTGRRIYGKGGAAEIVGVPPSTLQSRMKKLGVK